MADLIERQAAIDAIEKMQMPIMRSEFPEEQFVFTGMSEALSAIKELPSALSETELIKTGEWDMFELITSAWYGKQYYFKEDNGMAYSRVSGKMMTEDDAVKEFLREIADE